MTKIDLEKIALNITAPFVGNGILTKYNDKADSWIIKQIMEGKPGTALNVAEKPFNKRFSSVCKKVRTASLAKKECVLLVEGEKVTLSLRWLINVNDKLPRISEIKEIGDILKDLCKRDILALNDAFGVKCSLSEPRVSFFNYNVFAITTIELIDNVVDAGTIENKLYSTCGFEIVGEFK